MNDVTDRAATSLRPARPHRAAWWPDAVGVLTWATLLVVVALWVSGGGVADLWTSPAASLSSLGRLSGLLASNLMLLQVLGMARIPWAERSFGQDRLAGWHRWAGFWSFSLLFVHIATIIVGYSLVSGRTVLSQALSMVLTYPGMLLAAAGTALICLVVATSYRAVRRRIRYESWHLLHLYAYLGIALALPHQLWAGTDFARAPVASGYWLTFYALALASVLIYRVGVPLRMSVRHRLTVSGVVHERPGVVTIHLTGHRMDDLRVAAGQFFVWRFLTGPGWMRGHPLSLSAAPSTSGLRLTVGVSGDDGHRLAAVRPGTRVLVEGPYGRMTADVRTRPRIAVFAAGLGIAPLLALLQEDAGNPRPATLVYRLSTPGDSVLAADIAWLERHAGVRVVRLVGPRSRDGSGWLPESMACVPGSVAVKQLVPELEQHDVYICGPPVWTELVVVDLLAAGVPPSALHIESFTW